MFVKASVTDPASATRCSIRSVRVARCDAARCSASLRCWARWSAISPASSPNARRPSGARSPCGDRCRMHSRPSTSPVAETRPAAAKDRACNPIPCGAAMSQATVVSGPVRSRRHSSISGRTSSASRPAEPAGARPPSCSRTIIAASAPCAAAASQANCSNCGRSESGTLQPTLERWMVISCCNNPLFPSGERQASRRGCWRTISRPPPATLPISEALRCSRVCNYSQQHWKRPSLQPPASAL